MKKLGLLLALALVFGCTSTGMNVVFTAVMGQNYPAQTVYLTIKDLRTDKMVVGPKVQKEGLFGEVGSFVHLTAQRPNGKTTKLSNAEIEQVFYEAFRARLESQGFGLLPEQTAGRPALVIEVETFRLDMESGRKLKAVVAYMARIEGIDNKIRKQRIAGEQEEFYVSGKKTGEKVLSDAFTGAVNRLDLGSLMP